MARRAGIVAVFTLGSRILGYVRDAVLAHAFGAGVALDAFVAAQTIPNVFRRLVAEGTLMIAFVPILTEVRSRDGHPGARRFVASVLGALLPVLVGLTALGVLAPGLLVEAFAGGFDAERAQLAQNMTRVMMPYLFFVSLVAVASGALNAYGIFAAPAAAPMLLNVAVIGVVLLFRDRFPTPIVAAAWGVLLGGVLQALLQFGPLLRVGLATPPRWAPNDPDLRLLLRRMVPALFGVGVYQLNLIVIRQIASYLPFGQLSCYFYASRLEEFALGVFAVSISIAALPMLSQHAVDRDRQAFASTFDQALRATLFVTVPATAVLVGLGKPVVGTLFRYGAFDVESARLTVSLLRIMAVALVPIGFVRVLVPTYYAVGDTRSPVWAAFGSLLTTLGLGLGLGTRFEIVGLTTATTVAALVQAALLGVWLKGRILDSVGEAKDGQGFGLPWGQLFRCALAIAPWVLLGAWVGPSLDWYGAPAWTRASALSLGLLGLSVGYLGTARLLGVAEVSLLLNAVGRRLRARTP
ncbi:MAG: murein biosynthesis integral membrane protein MurJ [Myxococcota bacterium]